MQTFDYDISILRRQKAELGLIDAEIARKANVTPTTVANVLAERTRKASTIRRVTMALGLDLAELVVVGGGRAEVA